MLLLSILQCTGRHPQKGSIWPQILIVLKVRRTSLFPSLVYLPSGQANWPMALAQMWLPGASQVNLKPKQLVVMEKQGPEHSRMVSKVKVGSKVEWMVTERNVKLESSSEISTSNKCCIRKGMLDCKTFFKRLSKLLTPWVFQNISAILKVKSKYESGNREHSGMEDTLGQCICTWVPPLEEQGEGGFKI